MKHTVKYQGEPSEITITFDREEARYLMHLAGSLLGDPNNLLRVKLATPLFHLLNEAGVEGIKDQFSTNGRVREAS